MANPTPFDGTTTNKADFVVRGVARGRKSLLTLIKPPVPSSLQIGSVHS
jgi:hypothetical protein